MPQSPVIQILALMAQSLIILVLQLSLRPYQSRQIFFLEVFNEGSILTLLYAIFCIYMTRDQEDAQNLITYLSIFIIIFNIAVNWTIFMTNLLLFFKKNFGALFSKIKQKMNSLELQRQREISQLIIEIDMMDKEQRNTQSSTMLTKSIPLKAKDLKKSKRKSKKSDELKIIKSNNKFKEKHKKAKISSVKVERRVSSQNMSETLFSRQDDIMMRTDVSESSFINIPLTYAERSQEQNSLFPWSQRVAQALKLDEILSSKSIIATPQTQVPDSQKMKIKSSSSKMYQDQKAESTRIQVLQEEEGRAYNFEFTQQEQRKPSASVSLFNFPGQTRDKNFFNENQIKFLREVRPSKRMGSVTPTLKQMSRSNDKERKDQFCENKLKVLSDNLNTLSKKSQVWSAIKI